MTRRDDPQQHARIAERLRDLPGIQAALKRAARRAVREHALAGQPIAVWRNGRVVWEMADPVRNEPEAEQSQ